MHLNNRNTRKSTVKRSFFMYRSVCKRAQIINLISKIYEAMFECRDNVLDVGMHNKEVTLICSPVVWDGTSKSPENI